MEQAANVNPYLQAAGFGTQLLGTGVQAYGAYEAAQQAQKQYELAVKEYEDEKRRQEEQDRIAAQQMQFNNNLASGNYAQNMQDKVKNDYLSYARSIGM
jgi:hypothetical protein